MHCLEESGIFSFFILNLEIVFYYFSFQNMDKTNCNLEKQLSNS